jgi:hypothetical protein
VFLVELHRSQQKSVRRIDRISVELHLVSLLIEEQIHGINILAEQSIEDTNTKVDLECLGLLVLLILNPFVELHLIQNIQEFFIIIQIFLHLNHIVFFLNQEKTEKACMGLFLNIATNCIPHLVDTPIVPNLNPHGCFGEQIHFDNHLT